MNNPTTPPRRRAAATRIDVMAGICSCGTRVVRGDDEHGTLHIADVQPTDAAAELMARVAGRRSYVISYVQRGDAQGVKLAPRSDKDIKTKPVGFRPDRVVLAHDCKLTKETT